MVLFLTTETAEPLFFMVNARNSKELRKIGVHGIVFMVHNSTTKLPIILLP